MAETKVEPLSLLQKQNMASVWFEELRNLICAEFEAIEHELGSNAKFVRKSWDREGGGGGQMSVMYGEVFEKVGVNISTVHGKFPEKFAKEVPGASSDPSFWAAGISLVAHMKSPRVPSVHMNTRMIVTEKLWFGGGADLTPTFEVRADTEQFHAAFKQACDRYDESFYPKFKKECDEYFFIKHRNEPRGVGGIFYDNFNTGDWDRDFAYTKDVGLAFLDVFPKLVRQNYNLRWSEEDKEKQLFKRAKYAEFNLVYDRGTRFGFETGGNVDAILVSMPPLCAWK
jgi:coproporphyrinogen III oxidase